MNKSKIILGIHFGHDATVVLMENGAILEAMSEERLSRQKKHVGFPHLALDYITKKYSDKVFDKVIVVGLPEFSYGSAFVTLKQNEEGRKKTLTRNYYLRSIFLNFSLLKIVFVVRDTFINKRAMYKKGQETDLYLRKIFPNSSIEYIHHHLAHAYATVPFMDSHDRKVVLTCDGAGDDACATVNIYEEGKMNVISKTLTENSLGLLYCGIVDILGMSRNEHEFKVMGLAPYAKVSSGMKVYDKLKELIRYDQDTQTLKSKIRMQWSTEYLIAKEYYKYRFDSLAYGVQKITEEILVDMARHTLTEHNTKKLAIGGGVFMNVKANQKILELQEVEEFTVTPSCGDESLAVGAAVYGYSKYFDYKDIKKAKDIYWGSEYSDEDIKKEIDAYKFSDSVSVDYFEQTGEISIEKKVAELLSGDNVVGRFNGRAEWGARALGNRSILANPSKMDNVKLINEMIKNRDFWMPFATSLAEEHAEKYLHNEKMRVAPYMAITFETKPKAHGDIVAALHPYDKTSRPQIVSKATNESYHSIISEFHKITGIGGVLNTSFNLHGEPNVENPFDAIRTFDLSGMRYLAIGNYLVSKK